MFTKLINEILKNMKTMWIGLSNIGQLTIGLVDQSRVNYEVEL